MANCRIATIVSTVDDERKREFGRRLAAVSD